MKKKIWLVNPYAYPPQHETRLRAIKTAKFLQELGYDVLIFGGSFIHNTDINLINDNQKYICRQYDDLKFVHIKTDAYSGNGLKRFISLYRFHKIFKQIAKKFDAPDCIIHDIAIPFGAKTYKVAAKLKAQYIAQVQDLWPESFVAFGLIKREGFIHKILRRIEFKTYRKADKIIFSMAGGEDYIKNQKAGKKFDFSKVYYLNNGVDLAQFDYDREHNKLEDEHLCNDKIFKVIYLGSIRLANDVDRIVSAAQLIKDERIKILIYGDGDMRETLERRCSEQNISNVIFKEKHIDIKYVPYVVSCADLNILNYQNNEIWQYGGSQSKLFQYLAAGKPILSNLKIGHCIITQNECGVARPFDDDAQYAAAMKEFANMDKDEYLRLSGNARKTAQLYDYKHLTEKLSDIIEF